MEIMNAYFPIGVDNFQHAFAYAICCLSYPKNICDRLYSTDLKMSFGVNNDRIRVHNVDPAFTIITSIRPRPKRHGLSSSVIL